MKEITLTSDVKPLASQPDGPWQAGAVSNSKEILNIEILIILALATSLAHRDEISRSGIPHFDIHVSIYVCAH